MTINGKKYIVKVPTGKTTNDFQFDELLPAFRKYCAKVAQNQATCIAGYTNTLEVPQVMRWAALLQLILLGSSPSAWATSSTSTAFPPMRQASSCSPVLFMKTSAL